MSCVYAQHHRLPAADHGSLGPPAALIAPEDDHRWLMAIDNVP